MHHFIATAILDAGRRNVMRSVLIVLLLSSALCHGQSSDKTDIIELENGTVVVGEIKELHRGLLIVSTNGMSTINIEWGRVIALSTDKNFTVETADGFRAFGTISTSEDKSGIVIGALDNGQFISWPEVVVIQRIKDSFIKRWDGAMGIGLNAKRANDEISMVGTLDATYRTHKQIYRLDVYSSFSDRTDSTPSERYNLNLSHSAFIVTKWYSLAFANLEHNTELDLRLRTVVVGGARYGILHDSKNRLGAAIGLAVNNERYSIEVLDQTSAEGYLSLSYDFFKFRTPKADIGAELQLFPSLTEKNRYRTAINTRVRWEIVKKLWFDISLYYLADSNPPQQNAIANPDSQNPAGTDWGLNTSLQWRF